MTLYYRHPSSFAHDTGAHPENADRIRSIEAALEERDWLRAEICEAPRATREQLERAHTARHVDEMERFCADGGGMIDLDTVAVEHSWDAALRAAGAACEAVERVRAGEDRAAFCGLRPPGHHAERDKAMGFCLFNTIAVAAEHAIQATGAERVLICDWDVHHGNGTEEIFAASSDVLYSSIHQWPLYPGTGAADMRGTGPGEGYTLNLPVPAGSDSERFASLVEDVIVPAAREFRPGLIAISAGYDAHRDDPLGSCLVDEDGYGRMTAALRDVAAELDAPVLVCLEGGYDPDALAASVVRTMVELGV